MSYSRLECSLGSSTSDIVGTTTDLTLTLHTVNVIPAGGSIRLKTPLRDGTNYYAQSDVACVGGTVPFSL